jgi:2-polyprenyl-3-methyl-5-hydroxy-6-metoxy-1,4-benzoquinol methylase
LKQGLKLQLGIDSSGQAYSSKPRRYFSGERRDFIDRLDENKNRAILEIGCGDGATGAYAKSQGKCGRYVGVELFPAAAQIAAQAIDVVYTANIDNFDIPEAPGSFDALIASEVLEHLVDPWAVLKRLRPLLRPGAIVMASSPNAAHHSMIRMLLRGRWDLTDFGRMDRTHLRWFTPGSYAQMFRDCGFEVLSVEPLTELGPRSKLINALTWGRLKHLFISQIVVVCVHRGSQRVSILPTP